VSRYGLIAYASSLDVVGPIASSVMDAAVLLTAIAGELWLQASAVLLLPGNY
jgi:aspartyl-tRNA(Asn)/glutamyl-tRNA(Gln) amidotransferase subunit A